jgi:serine/threonine-protein kinase PpkA
MASPGQPTESAQTGLTTGETREKTGFLRRRRTYRIDLHAEDFEAFRPRFDQVMTELMEWRQKRGRKTGAVRFHGTIHPWIAGRVKDYLRKLRRSSSHDWLSQVPLYIELTAPDGEIISSEVLEPDEPAGRH